MSRYDFDTVYDRTGTNSLKWDFHAERHHDPDELPLWVADMDFKSPEPVLSAIAETVKKGFFGYTVAKREDKKIVSDYLYRRHSWRPDPEDIIFAPGVCFSLSVAIHAFSEPNDAVMITEPVYYPFASLVRDAGRKLVRNELVRNEAGRYVFDFDAFERQITEEKVKLYILCSPHNPVGRVWEKEELLRIGRICLEHGVIPLADEIHADFVYEGNRHIPFSSLSEEFEKASVTFTSPSKTFNMAGLQIAEVIAHDEGKRNRFRKVLNGLGYAEIPVTGFAAMKAAYTECDDWVDALVRYVYENILYMRTFLLENIPVLSMDLPEGTYLPWVDCRGLGLSGKDLEDLMRNRAKLWLDAGYIFGESGKGYQRFNAACPRAILTDALKRLKTAIDGKER